MRNGFGVFSYSNRNRYGGEWKNNIEEGYGVFEWENGDIFKGMFRNGKRNGEGEYYFAEGKEWRKGHWENDVLKEE